MRTKVDREDRRPISHLSHPSMAETETPSSGKMDTADMVKGKAAPLTRPERPDEEQYKKELAKAEKELHEAEERMVRL